MVTGTAANALALAACCPPHGAVVCHAEAHITTDECGAPEFFTGGAKLLGVRGAAGKLTPAAVAAMLDTMGRGEHEQRPSVLSLAQATELGTVYTPDEVAGLAALARSRRLHVHMDGARFANAVVRLGTTPAAITLAGRRRRPVVRRHQERRARGRGGDRLRPRARRRLPVPPQARRSTGVEEPLPRGADARLSRWRSVARHGPPRQPDGRLAGPGDRAPRGVRLPLPVQANEVFAIVPRTLDERWRAAARAISNGRARDRARMSWAMTSGSSAWSPRSRRPRRTCRHWLVPRTPHRG